MVGKTHVVIGLTTLVGVDALTGLVQPHPVREMPVGPFLCLSAAIVGALLPDIDAEDSQIRYEMGEVGLAMSNWLQSFGVQHRGLTHYGLTTLVVIVVSALLGWWLGYLDVGLAFSLGYLSHVLADGLTLAGVPLLWPWRREKNVHLLPPVLRIRTGGPVEPLLFLVFTGVLIVLLPWLIPPESLRLLDRWL